MDKWLWYARVTKSRTLAQKLASSGRIRINNEKTSSGNKAVRVGDMLTITLERRVLVLKVAVLGTHRGPYIEAQKLYEDFSPPPPKKEEVVASPGLREAGAGRPTKRDRRRIEAFRDPD